MFLNQTKYRQYECSRKRRISYTVPKWISFWKEHVVLAETAANAVFYNLSLEGMDHPWQAYSVKISPLQCSSEQTTSEKPHFGLARFSTNGCFKIN